MGTGGSKKQAHSAADAVRRNSPVQGTVDSPELALIQVDAVQVETFLASLAPFFREAATLEREAKETLALARQTLAPTSKDEDEQVQRAIIASTGQKKRTADHWWPCQALSKLHRLTTTARGRGVDALEEAGAILNRLHNGYVDAERRRAAAEQERLRHEAEDDARRQQEAEAARLDAEALKAEQDSPTLSARELVFVERIVSHGALDSVRAAQIAGYKDFRVAAERLMKSPKIQNAIQAKKTAAAIRQQATARREQPLDVQVEDVRPEISRAAGGHDRTTWSCEILDPDAFVAAALSGKYGIPHDAVMPNAVKLNGYAGALMERMNAWPGVRAKKNTKVVGGR